MSASNQLRLEIGKAARLLDLRGDTAGAKSILESVIARTSEADVHIRLEALVFLADVLAHEGHRDAALDTLRQAGELDLSDVEPDLVDSSLERAADLRRELLSLSS
jgi:predicted negative regulator of RcsB-dependent stress response